MDLSRFLPNFGDTEVQLTEEELDKQDRDAKKARTAVGRLGPRSFRTPTNGQIRRMQIRSAKTAQRKANQRYRRQWLETEARLASLKAQVRVVTGITPATPDTIRNAHLALIRDYATYDEAGNLTNDPVEAAVDHLNRVVNNRRAAIEAARA